MEKNPYGLTKAIEVMTKAGGIAIKQMNGKPTMSTLRIAEVTGKEHSDVLKSCRKIFDELDLAEGKYSLS